MQILRFYFVAKWPNMAIHRSLQELILVLSSKVTRIMLSDLREFESLPCQLQFQKSTNFEIKTQHPKVLNTIAPTLIVNIAGKQHFFHVYNNMCCYLVGSVGSQEH